MKRSLPAGVPPAPCALPGFAHVKRFYDGNAKTWTAQVLPGEYYVTCGDEVITTVLGSCVSACIRDVEIGIAGLNHFMLPADPDPKGNDASTRFGQYALECLIDDLVKHGGRRERFEVKIFGGGKVLPGLSDVGLGNVQFVRKFLATERLPISAEDTSGNCARRLRYHAPTGRVWIKRLPVGESMKVIECESELRKTVQRRARKITYPELF